MAKPNLEQSKNAKGYYYCLRIDDNLIPYVKNLAIKDHKSIARYLNNLIRADLEKHLAKSKKGE